jgi:drug/metabolite transporter (DMT)-like permease
MQMVWLGIAIAGAAAYHIVLKLTPAGANPYLSLGVTYSATALLLLIVGVAWFGDKLSLTNLAGIALCVIGLWLINRR